MSEKQVFDVLYHELDLTMGRKVWRVITVESVDRHSAKRNVAKMLRAIERGSSVRLFPVVSQVGQPGQFDSLIGKPLRFSDRAWS